MITKISLIGLSLYFFVQSVFQIREQAYSAKQVESVQFYKEAEDYFDKGQYDSAISKYLSFIEKYKDNEELTKQAKFHLMISYYKKKMYEDMFKIAKELVRDYKDEEIGKMALFFIGEYYFYKKKYDYAVVSYQMFINKIPSSPYLPIAYFNSAKSYYESKKIDETISLLKKMEKKFSRSALMPDVKYFLIALFLQKDEPYEAEKRVKQVERAPNIVKLNEIYFNMGEYYFSKNNYTKAIYYYNKVEDKNKLITKIEEKLDAYRKAKQQQEELVGEENYDRIEEQQWWKEYDYEALYQEAKESKNYFPEALFRIGSCYLDMGKLDLANKTFEILKTKYQDEKELIAKIPSAEVLLYTKQKKYDKLREKIKSIKDEDTKIQVLQSLFSDQAYEFIIKEYENKNFEFTKPEYREVSLYIVATSYFVTKRYKEAITIYSMFLKEYPKSEYFIVSKSNLAMAYFNIQDYNSAIAEYKSIIDLNPKEVDYVKVAILQLAEIYKTLNNKLEAINYYKMFIDRFPTSEEVPDIIIIIANLYLELKDYQNAVNYYTDFIIRYPNHEMVKDAMLQIAILYKENKQYKEMADMFKKIVEKFPNDKKVAPVSYYWLGWYNKEQKNYQDAISCFDVVISSFPEDENVVVAQYDKSECYAKLGQYEQAINEYLKLLDFAAQGRLESKYVFSLIDEVFKLYKNLGKQEQEAISNLTNLLQTYKTTKVGVLIGLKISEFYYKNKDYTSAVNVLDSISESLYSYKGNAEEYYFIADIFFNGKSYAKAFEFYKKAVISAPGTKTAENAAWGMCDCYVYLNDDKLSSDIVKYVEPYYSKIKKAPTVSQALGRSYFVLKNYKKAITYLEPVVPILSEKEGAQWIFMLADSYFETGNYQEAIKFYAKIVLVFPDNKDYLLNSYYKTANCYEKLGEIQKAKEMYLEIVNKYPNTEYAIKAQEQLKKL
jgi:tetratricopeptide (TPR) repeat protein